MYDTQQPETSGGTERKTKESKREDAGNPEGEAERLSRTRVCGCVGV